MVDKAEITAFMSRWRISLPEQKVLEEFRTRVTNSVKSFQSEWGYSNSLGLIDLEKAFASINGSTYQADTHHHPANMRTYSATAGTFLQLILVLQRIFWAAREYAQSNHLSRDQAQALNAFLTRINQAIDYSAGINLRKLEVHDGVVDLYPEGVTVLDHELVDSAVAWLREFPEVAQEYRSALATISIKDTSAFRQALDSLRFALEKLLKIVLTSNAPLEKQKQPLLAWMKTRGVHAQIRNNYATMLDQFASFQNDFVKHDNDPTAGRTYSLHETEYMVYLTGALIRLILQVRNAA